MANRLRKADLIRRTATEERAWHRRSSSTLDYAQTDTQTRTQALWPAEQLGEMRVRVSEPESVSVDVCVRRHTCGTVCSYRLACVHARRERMLCYLRHVVATSTSVATLFWRCGEGGSG